MSALTGASEGGLYKSDKEIARLVGVSYEHWLDTAKALERRGLPKRDPEFCSKRYWPAVRAFLDRREGLGAASTGGTVRTWEENFDE